MSNLPPWPKHPAFPDRATAEAWANAPGGTRLYVSSDEQRIKLAQEWLAPVPCPNCETPMPVVDAIHVEGDHFVCSQCEAKLLFTVPLFGGGGPYWCWSLEPHQIPTPDSRTSEKAGA